jgi:hypothetical protein
MLSGKDGRKWGEEMGSRRNKMKKQSLRKTLLFRRKEKREKTEE